MTEPTTAFVDLFNGMVKADHVLSDDFNRTDVIALFVGIKNTPTAYGLGQNASDVAAAFLYSKGNNKIDIYDIIVNPITAGGMAIKDVGAALGYFFSKQPATVQNLKTGYRPIMNVYGRYIHAVQETISMSVIAFDSSTSKCLYGSSLADNADKTATAKSRGDQLRDAVTEINMALPALPAKPMHLLAMEIANVRVSQVIQQTKRKVKKEKLRLYKNLLTALIATTNGKYPMTVTFQTDLSNFNDALKAIVDAEGGNKKLLIEAVLAPDAAFKTHIETRLLRCHAALFGHCAETLPFVKMIGNLNQNHVQGLAMIPSQMKDLEAAKITAGTVSYDTIKTYRYPCENCYQVLEVVGIPKDDYNSYITNTVKTFDNKVQ